MSARASLLLALLGLVGCATHTLPGPVTSTPSLAGQGMTFKAGAARADITPPPGVSMFGHGPESRVANGIWTRLYCRAFVLVQDDPSKPSVPGAALAIVPCDLPAMSALLHRTTAEKLSKLGVPIGATRLMMTATHTHAGPGHYLDGTGYAGSGSAHAPGFDPAMVEYLAIRIAAAIKDAYDKRESAKLRWSRSRVFNLTRNRSLPAFVRNVSPPWPQECKDRTELCAIDPDLAILELQTIEKGCSLGTLTFFAMHPTVIPSSNQFLGADVFGVASRALEKRARDDQPAGCTREPIAGIVNTNEGDQVPRWTSGSVEEAVALGAQLGEAASQAIGASEVAKAGFEAAPLLAARYLEVDMRSNGFGITRHDPTCDEPELGIYGARGGTDHKTFLVPYLPGNPRDPTRDSCHAPKVPLPWPLSGMSSGREAFPSIIPFASVRIHDQVISFVPAELTLAAGDALDRAVVQALEHHQQAVHSVVAGLSNSYIQYVATRDEYALQAYEASTTLFGPSSAELFKNVSVALALSASNFATELPSKGKLDRATELEYWTGAERERLPRGTSEPTLDELGTQRRAIRTCSVRGRPEAVCFMWTDGAPGVVPIDNPPWVVLTAGDKVILDDQGVAFRTRIHRASEDSWIWTTLVHPQSLMPKPRTDWAFAGDSKLTIRVAPGTPYEIRSDSFSAQAFPKDCSAEQQALCGY